MVCYAAWTSTFSSGPGLSHGQAIDLPSNFSERKLEVGQVGRAIKGRGGMAGLGR